MTIVNIGKKVDYKNLEIALVNAAEEVGLKARVKHLTRKEYELGSVQTVEKYYATDIYLKGKLFPAAKVTLFNKKPQDFFSIHNGFPFGFAPERKVKQYLGAVSKILE